MAGSLRWPCPEKRLGRLGLTEGPVTRVRRRGRCANLMGSPGEGGRGQESRASARSPVHVSHPSAVPQSWFASSTRKLKYAEGERSLSESSHRCGEESFGGSVLTLPPGQGL